MRAVSLMKCLLPWLCIPSAASVDVHAQRVLPPPVVRDSAGSRIIEYPSMSPATPLSARSSPSPFSHSVRALPFAVEIQEKWFTDLGGDGSDANNEFDARHSSFGVVELSDGTIVVNDRVDLKYFSRDGKRIRTVGREGGGPGEFRQTTQLCRLRGDTILVFDFDGRTSLWDRSGTHIRTFPRVGRTLTSGCRDDGAYVVQQAGTASRSSDGSMLAESRLIRADGQELARLGKLPTFEAAGLMFWEPTILPINDYLLVGGARRFEFAIQSFSGRPIRTTRFGRSPMPITNKDWQERAEHQVPRGLRSDIRAKRLAQFIAEKPAGFYPAYLRILRDPLGYVWIQDFESSSGWTLFDANGRLAGRVELRGGELGQSSLIAAFSDHVVLLRRDGDGAPHLQFHRISPRPLSGAPGKRD